MTLFYVGQTVDAGSGVYYEQDGHTYHWLVQYTGPSRTVTWEGDYVGSSSELFVMNFNDPVSALTVADIGTWSYLETWTDLMSVGAGGEGSIGYSTSFEVAAVPEPGTLMLLGSGLLGLALTGARKKFRK